MNKTQSEMILKKQFSALEQEARGLRDEVKILKTQLEYQDTGSQNASAIGLPTTNIYQDLNSQYTQDPRGSGWLNLGMSPYGNSQSSIN
jgi:hypothetical protein